MRFKLKPEELDEPRYYLYLLLIAGIILGILQVAYQGEMFTFKNVFLSALLLLIADVIAHTVLRLN